MLIFLTFPTLALRNLPASVAARMAVSISCELMVWEDMEKERHSPGTHRTSLHLSGVSPTLATTSGKRHQGEYGGFPNFPTPENSVHFPTLQGGSCETLQKIFFSFSNPNHDTVIHH
jgi:hypothetical protein